MSLTDAAMRQEPRMPLGSQASRPAPDASAPGGFSFAADRESGPDLLDRAAHAGYLAELATHKNTATPLGIGVFGSAGSGKSTFMAALLRAAERLAQGARDRKAGAFVAEVVTAKIEVQPGVQPAPALMSGLYAALGARFPKLALDAIHAGSDPRAAARDAGERLNEARQRLDAERRSLDELSGRRARLTENVLFDTAGSRIDSYARANRGRIERSLRRFGFTGDSMAGYKDLVRETSESPSLSRGPGLLRAFYAYRGQSRLIVTAVLLFLIAWGLAVLFDHQTEVVGSIRSLGENMGNTADWVGAHWSWLNPVRTVAVVGGVLALLLNLFRGLRFLQPVLRGASLLRGDVDKRRRDLDSLLAHQTRRVDSLVSEADLASQQAADAESRLASGPAAGLPAGVPLAAAGGEAGSGAEAFFAAVGAALATPASDGSEAKTPSRIVVGLDGLDRLTPDAAAQWLATAGALLGRPGFVTVVAAEREHLASGLAEADPALAHAHLNRAIQVPYWLAGDSAWEGGAGFVRSLLGTAGTTRPPARAESPAGVSALDKPWRGQESAVLEALAPLAGGTPRAVKRYVNLYRIARSDPTLADATAQELGCLALALALDIGGWPADPATLRDDPEVRPALQAAEVALGSTLDPQIGRRGFETARHYASRG